MKKYILTLLSLLIGIGCLVSQNIIGSTVAPNGTLIETFYLIPIGFSFIALALISSAFIGFRKPINQ
ncbi:MULTISPECIES: DUF3955 domain-containing protein [Bacillus]|uniref:DUF3955 domain-containing protein n=2 Tax=Bacillus pseudomycoides TaxID=64104 RepID=A0A1Y3M5X2_9BACI|nr:MULTISPECIES: DUF3955 domain-containing protein [Bacillus cereus group]EOP51443.1 hypothetical protein IIW_02198 [Bacillus cereus VD136]EOP68660.1 hypothetical protein KOW_03869 [Bacillus cereus VDM006]EOQ04750.1 hypothetical protein KOY_03094 [Bacillus cereus VDM021]OOG89882.1 hypothetical protein BTH41_04416 [Bacillus mycoides]MDF2085877.1 DUF3955 domain-containing protein [Bacillus pseudomycoides]